MVSARNESILSGIFACLGSTLGKLTAATDLIGTGYSVYIVLLVAMVFANTCGMRYYLRSLDGSDSSVSPTVISSATNYVASGLVGVFLFGETSSFKWWIGLLLVILGLTVLTRTNKHHSA